MTQGQGTRLSIGWDELEGIVRGISAIDMRQMTIESLEEAEEFILSYGYDFKDPKDWASLVRLQQESIGFIERQLLDANIPWKEMDEEPLSFSIPEAFKEEQDVRHLILHASSNEGGIEQQWACAILKVMHILCHVQNAALFRHFEIAKKQILARYNRILSHSDSGTLMLGDPEDFTIPIAGFEVKDIKSQDSILLKLLCKRETVAEEVFDMIGVRIITHTPAEAVIAVEILHRNNIVMFPNIIPSRSRNSLIDFDEFKAQYQDHLDKYCARKESFENLMKAISSISTEDEGIFNPENISTSGTYRSIHITERQLIRLTSKVTNAEARFFFPYEVQVVDEAHYVENLAGSSAHARYKLNQLVQARRRVLGPLLIYQRRNQKQISLNT